MPPGSPARTESCRMHNAYLLSFASSFLSYPCPSSPGAPCRWCLTEWPICSSPYRIASFSSSVRHESHVRLRWARWGRPDDLPLSRGRWIDCGGYSKCAWGERGSDWMIWLARVIMIWFWLGTLLSGGTSTFCGSCASAHRLWTCLPCSDPRQRADKGIEIALAPSLVNSYFISPLGFGHKT